MKHNNLNELQEELKKKGIQPLCPICNQPFPGMSGYFVKLIPTAQMAASNRPHCDFPKCYNVAWWNVNNGSQILCEKHFKGLVMTGYPILILSKSLVKPNAKPENPMS